MSRRTELCFEFCGQCTVFEIGFRSVELFNLIFGISRRSCNGREGRQNVVCYVV